jgi:hypothetical protein
MLTTIYILIFLIPVFGCLAVSSKEIEIKNNYEDIVELLILVLFVMLLSLILNKYIFKGFI